MQASASTCRAWCCSPASSPRRCWRCRRRSGCAWRRCRRRPASALLAAVALWLLLRQERRARDPLLPLALLAEPTILRSNLLTACAHGALIALLTFLPIYLQSVRGVSPAMAGLLLLPLSLGSGIGGLTAGRLMTHTGIAMPFARLGLGVAAAALALVAVVAGGLPDCGTGAAVRRGGAGLRLFLSGGRRSPCRWRPGRRGWGRRRPRCNSPAPSGAAVATAVVGALLFGTLAAGDAGVAALFARLVRAGPALLAQLQPAEQMALRAGLAVASAPPSSARRRWRRLGSWLAGRVPLQRLG